MRTRAGQRYQQVWDRRTRRMVSFHRLVAEYALGRALASHEVVHHLDGNRGNNDPANLAVLSSQSVHAHLEALLRKERGGQMPLFTEFGSAAIVQQHAVFNPGPPMSSEEWAMGVPNWGGAEQARGVGREHSSGK